MAISNIVAIGAAAVISLLSARFSREPKYHRCIDGYAQCISAKVADEECQKILTLCDKKKKNKD